MPRRYDMTKRAAAREATRRRIVEATAKLHGERGVLGTSWQDIAKEADVAVATVYAHFPSLDELLPACGRHVMERIRPPSSDDAKVVIADAPDPAERLRRVARELFAFYDRGGPHIEVDIRERQIPGMREWEEHQRRTVAAFVAAAVSPSGASSTTVQLISALFDLPTYRAFRERGRSRVAAADTVVTAALAVLADKTDKRERRTA